MEWKGILMTHDETEIRALVERWAAATRHDQKDEVLSGHATDVLIYDVLPPMMYKGTAEYRKSWDEWQPSFETPSLFEVQDLKVVVGGDAAWCHGLIRCGGRLPDGKEVENLVRATFCLTMRNGKWQIAHQHLSMPLPQ
jgi:ketosteroid isomerase-like protein